MPRIGHALTPAEREERNARIREAYAKSVPEVGADRQTIRNMLKENAK